MIARDNLWLANGGIYLGNLGGCSPGPSGSYTASNNLNCACSGTSNITGTPIFAGGTNPTTYAGYRLAPGSPGKGAASDGTDIGIH